MTRAPHSRRHRETDASLSHRFDSLVLFAAAHTVGFLRFVPPNAEGIAVRDAMRNVHFALRGGSYSYGGFYDGFGLSVSVYLLFSAFLAWHLGTLAARDPKAIGMLGWVFCAMEIAQLAICAMYFFFAARGVHGGRRAVPRRRGVASAFDRLSIRAS